MNWRELSQAIKQEQNKGKTLADLGFRVCEIVLVDPDGDGEFQGHVKVAARTTFGREEVSQAMPLTWDREEDDPDGFDASYILGEQLNKAVARITRMQKAIQEHEENKERLQSELADAVSNSESLARRLEQAQYTLNALKDK